jgi:hypothetical protein
MPSSSLPATPRQLAYLRRLASKPGTSFTPPASRSDANHEIGRLKAIRKNGFTFAEHEQYLREANQVQPRYAPSIRDDEIEGYGSTATWGRRR